MLLPVLFFITLFSLCLSDILTRRVHAYLLARTVLDIPNERSMHKTPVPRGGGLAVVATIALGLLLFVDKASFFPTLYLLVALAGLVFVSWLDDKGGVKIHIRLALHLIAAFIGSFALGQDVVLFNDLLPFWLDRLVLVLGWGWFMNLYNFMDGIDGITSVQSACCAFGVGLLFLLTSPNDLSPLILPCLIIGASLGFLRMNWHPAKVFLGDVGSVPLGFLIGFLLLKLACSGLWISALLIPLYYVADSGLTIAHRALRKEKIWQAHREHFYQRATAGEGSPAPVVLWILVANSGLIASAMISKDDPWLGAPVGVGILVLLLTKLSHSSRKTLKS